MPYPYPREEEEQPASANQLMDMYGSMAQQGPAATDGFGFTPRRPMTESLTALQESGAFEPFDARRSIDFAFGTIPTALEATANLTNLERAREEGFGANLQAAGEVVRSHVAEPGSVNYETYLREINFPMPKVGALAMAAIEPGFGELKAFGGAIASAVRGAADLLTPAAFLLPMRKAFTGGTGPAQLMSALGKQKDAAGRPMIIDADVLREPMLRLAEQRSSISKGPHSFSRMEADIGAEMHHNLKQAFAAAGHNDPTHEAHKMLDPYLRFGQDYDRSDLQSDFWLQRENRGVISAGSPEHNILNAYTDVAHSEQYLGVQVGDLSANPRNILGLRAVSDSGIQYLERVSGRYDPSLYTVMNSILRRGLNVVRGEMSPRDFGAITEAIQLLDGAFDGRFVTTVPAVGYRGTVINKQWLTPGVENDPRVLIGNTIQDAAYSSYSDSHHIAFNFLRTKNFRPKTADEIGVVYQMEIPVGSPVIPMRHVSTFAQEAEILLPRGVGVKILDVEDRGSYILALGEPDFSMSPAVQKRQAP